MTKRDFQNKEYVSELQDKELAITYVDLNEEEVVLLFEYSIKLDDFYYRESDGDPALFWMGELAYNLREIAIRAELNKGRGLND